MVSSGGVGGVIIAPSFCKAYRRCRNWAVIRITDDVAVVVYVADGGNAPTGLQIGLLGRTI